MALRHPWTRDWLVTGGWGRSSVPLTLILLLGSGCAPDTVQVKTTPYFSPAQVRTVALAPFDFLSTPQEVFSNPSRIPPADVGPSAVSRSFEREPSPSPTRLGSRTVTIPPGASEKITKMVYSNLLTRSGIHTISQNQTAQSLAKMMSSGQELQSKEKARWLGKALSVDAVLFGFVRVYRERAGSELAATPAAVGFELRLVSAVDGAVLWVGSYYEEQKPLTEDLRGFWERRGKFVTAEQLAQSGVNRVMQRFPL